MPDADRKALAKEFIAENVELAIAARERAPWGKDIPEEIFLNDVLPYANLNEKRDAWRGELSAQSWEIVKNCMTASEAALELNAKIFKVLDVKYHPTKRPKPDQSPLESIAAHYASCSGLSILLVDACRAVSVPARVVGIPDWATPGGDANGNHGGNHTWVEIFDGQWHALGASEVSPLDQTWFMGKAAQADPSKMEHRIYAASFRKSDVWFPLVWDWGNRTVPAEDVTYSYLKRTKVTIRVDGTDVRHVTIRHGGQLVADVKIKDSTEVVLSGGEKYQAAIDGTAKEFTAPAQAGQIIPLSR